jgi:hypothetical protein
MNREMKIASRIVADSAGVWGPGGIRDQNGIRISFHVEGGITRHSIDNAQMIRNAGFQFVQGICRYDKRKGDYYLDATFQRAGQRVAFTFSGFSWGYGGEGPHGLLEFGRIFGIHLDPRKVMGGADMPDAGKVDLVQAFG